MLNVAEKFVSINGEGAHAGELAAFLRFKGCNLCCSYCDTRWANEENAPCKAESARELCDWVLSQNVANVTLTGGEPLLQQDIPLLIKLLTERGRRVEIETNGSVELKPFDSLSPRPVFTMDYKLPSSGMENKMCLDNMALLKKHDTVKFVAGSREDLMRAAEIISRYGLTGRCHVYFSPVFGSIEPEEIVSFMKERRLNGVRLQLQLHKFIWRPDKRGV